MNFFRQPKPADPEPPAATSTSRQKDLYDVSKEELVDRIVHLEKQVQGLMNTVLDMHAKLYMDRHGVARPDLYVSTAIAARQEETRSLLDLALSRKERREGSSSLEAALVKRVDAVKKTQPYVYTPLDRNSTQVRVIALEREDREDRPIACRMLTIDLSDLTNTPANILRRRAEQQFTPLSYTWGDPTATAEILIDGAPLKITAALHKALLRLRRLQTNLLTRVPVRTGAQTDRETFWWIDAICINQQDIDERSHQVSLMTRLYASAKHIHVWLGESTEQTKTAMRLVRHLGYKPRSLEEIKSWEYIRKPGQTHRPGGGPGQPEVLLPAEWIASKEEKENNFRALTTLFRRPWFSRVWIRQEIALPEHVSVHCGDEQCSWEELMRVANILSFYSDGLAIPCLQHEKSLAHLATISSFENAAALDEVRAATMKGKRYVSFRNLAFHTRNSLATDPRDKVFAMLPMTDPDEISSGADYRLDVQGAYEKVLLPLMSSSLDFLAACQNESLDTGRPSWIPDFSQPWSAQPIWPYLSSKRAVPDYNFRHGKPEVTYDAEKARLGVLGVILDKADRIHEETARPEITVQEARDLFHSWWTFTKQRRQELLDETETTGIAWQSIKFINSCYDESVWDKMCFDPSWDRQSHEPCAQENSYPPKHHSPRWYDQIASDPVFRRMQHTLLEGVDPDKLLEGKGLAHFRRLAVGRRVAMTSEGLSCLVPNYVQLGDSLVWFRGSSETFVIRPNGEDTWSIIGSTYLTCHINDDTIKREFTPATITLV